MIRIIYFKFLYAVCFTLKICASTPYALHLGSRDLGVSVHLLVFDNYDRKYFCIFLSLLKRKANFMDWMGIDLNFDDI
ncbi:hypothetical protein LguiA_034837 [Lonicera macranthoides]